LPASSFISTSLFRFLTSSDERPEFVAQLSEGIVRIPVSSYRAQFQKLHHGFASIWLLDVARSLYMSWQDVRRHLIIAVEKKIQILQPPLRPNFFPAKPPNKLAATVRCKIASRSNHHLFKDVASTTFEVNLMWKRKIPMPGFFPSILRFLSSIKPVRIRPLSWAKSMLHWYSDETSSLLRI
jgi:hypothetical protein